MGARPQLPQRQRGLAMLVFLAFFAVTAAYLLVRSLNRTNVALTIARAETNRDVLQQARAALIAWSASEALQGTSNFQPGALPCPDSDNNGTSDYSGSNCVGYVGRLPYNTLGIAPLYDASGELLWYAVSSNFRRLSTNVINSNTLGSLTLTGLAPASNVIAVVLAPGMRLGSQDRSATGANTASNYLEDTNGVASSTSFVSKTENLTDSVAANLFNDQLLAISSQDLFSVVEPVVAARIERDIKPDLLTYFSSWNSAYPYAAKFANPDPGTSATRAQSQYIGNSSTASTGGLLPITASAAYTWSAGSVTKTGGTSGSLSGVSCASTASPFSGWKCSFTINAYAAPWWDSVTCSGSSYCMVNPRFSVSASAANAGLSFSTPPAAGDVSVTNSTGGTTRAMTSTSITATLASSGAGNIVYQGTHSYSKYSSSSFTRTMVVTIPNVTASPVTSSGDATAGWFISNEWYRLVYYMVSPGYLPGAGASCTALPGTPSCLTVNNMPAYYSSPSTDKRALLILAGRSLNGSARPSSSLGDYFEGQNTTPSDYIFEHGAGKLTSTAAAINDKVIIIAP